MADASGGVRCVRTADETWSGRRHTQMTNHHLTVSTLLVVLLVLGRSDAYRSLPYGGLLGCAQSCLEPSALHHQHHDQSRHLQSLLYRTVLYAQVACLVKSMETALLLHPNDRDLTLIRRVARRSKLPSHIRTVIPKLQKKRDVYSGPSSSTQTADDKYTGE